MSPNFEQIDKINQWCDDKKVYLVNLKFEGFFDREPEIKRWLTYYRIKTHYLDEFIFESSVVRRNIVIINPFECNYYFTKPDYAMLFKLTWSNHDD